MMGFSEVERWDALRKGVYKGVYIGVYIGVWEEEMKWT